MRCQSNSHASAYLPTSYTGLHNTDMDYPTVLRDMMKTGRLNQAQLAKRLRVTQPTVSRWVGGTQRPEIDQHQRIAKEAQRLGLDRMIEELEAAGVEDEEQPKPTVPVKGYVSAGAAAHYLPLSNNELDWVDAPKDATEKTIALEIRGDSLGALFDRWLVFYDEVRSPVTSDLIGKTCVVGLADGRILVKKLKRARDDLYDLFSNTEEPIKGVVVEWAAEVRHMGPR